MKQNNQEAKNDILLNVPVKFKIVESKAGEQKGVVEAYVSIFDNVDLVGDVIVKGAFAESLAKKLPKGVWAHNWDEPIALTLQAREDDKGLFIQGQFIEGVQKADEAYKLIKAGVIDEFSIGFRVLDDEWREDGVRVIKKAKLYEWSPVLAGANPDTELVSIKSEKHKADCKCDDCTPGEKPAGTKEEKQIRKIDFVKVDEAKGIVELFYKEDGKKKSKVLKMSDNFIKYQKELKTSKAKVEQNGEGNATHQKILRIKQVAKQNLKANQYLLRIIKN